MGSSGPKVLIPAPPTEKKRPIYEDVALKTMPANYSLPFSGKGRHTILVGE